MVGGEYRRPEWVLKNWCANEVQAMGQHKRTPVRTRFKRKTRCGRAKRPILLGL